MNNDKNIGKIVKPVKVRCANQMCRFKGLLPSNDRTCRNIYLDGQDYRQCNQKTTIIEYIELTSCDGCPIFNGEYCNLPYDSDLRTNENDEKVPCSPNCKLEHVDYDGKTFIPKKVLVEKE